MQETALQNPVLHFDLYPPVGDEDWRYTFATAQVRTLEDRMLSAQLFTEMANAANGAEAIELLAQTDYAISPTATDKELEQILCDIRRNVRRFVEQLIIDEEIVRLFRARSDFANMRLAVRRLVLEKPLGTDYCDQGNIPIAEFEQVFEQEDYSTLPVYLQEGVEAGVLGYYKNKNVRDIDLAIDRVEARVFLENAIASGCVFLEELFRMQIDLANIRTMMRMKFTGIQDKDVFIPGGYIDTGKLTQCIDMAYESLAQNFAATSYYNVVESGAAYLQKENSFLRLEAACDEHLLGFLKTTRCITAGPQPIIAYLLMKEHEIRNVRMVLTAKRNGLESKVILERLRC